MIQARTIRYSQNKHHHTSIHTMRQSQTRIITHPYTRSDTITDTRHKFRCVITHTNLHTQDHTYSETHRDIYNNLLTQMLHPYKHKHTDRHLKTVNMHAQIYITVILLQSLSNTKTQVILHCHVCVYNLGLPICKFLTPENFR